MPSPNFFALVFSSSCQKLTKFYFYAGPFNWIFVRVSNVNWRLVFVQMLFATFVLTHLVELFICRSNFSVSFSVQTSTHKQKWRRNAINLSSVELKCICHKVFFFLCALSLFLPVFSHHTTLISINDLTWLRMFWKILSSLSYRAFMFSWNLSKMIQLNRIWSDFGGLSALTFTCTMKISKLKSILYT